MLLVIFPFLCFIVSLIYGIKYGFNLLYSASIWTNDFYICYSSAAGYIVGYGILALGGNLISVLYLTYKKKYLDKSEGQRYYG